MPSFLKLATAALAVASASAQTYSDCNPLKKTCPADKGSTESSMKFDFTKNLDQWSTVAGNVDTDSSNGATFTINKKGDAPTIETDFYIFFGDVSVTMKAAPGTGIVSSIVFESDDLDEIDWEALGGDSTSIETNYFGKGDTSSYDRDTWPGVSDPQNEWHTYKVSWQKDATTWYIDGNAVRTLKYADAQGGSRYPQTPMRVRIGIWAGGDPSNGQGTIEWAGGETDYSQAPFSMYIKNVEINNANPAESYTYSDNTGSMDSIKFTGSDAVSSSSSSSSSTSTTSASSKSTDSSSTTSDATSTTEASATKTSDSTSATSASETTSGSTATSTGSGSGSGSGSSSAVPSGSATPTSGSGSGSDSGSGSSSTSGTPAGSSSAASPTASFNAAVGVVANYFTPLSLLAVITAFFQL